MSTRRSFITYPTRDINWQVAKTEQNGVTNVRELNVYFITHHIVFRAYANSTRRLSCLTRASISFHGKRLATVRTAAKPSSRPNTLDELLQSDFRRDVCVSICSSSRWKTNGVRVQKAPSPVQTNNTKLPNKLTANRSWLETIRRRCL